MLFPLGDKEIMYFMHKGYSNVTDLGFNVISGLSLCSEMYLFIFLF